MERLERLVNLVAALIDTPRPLTREEIHDRIEGYSDDPIAFRRNFERDKELLRRMGLPLSTVALDATRPDELGYRIPREEYELPDPGLDDDELAALRLASAAIQLEGAGGSEGSVKALRRLGGAVGDETSVGLPLAALPGGDAAGVAFGAIAERRRVGFDYRGERRSVDPWRLSFRRGQWYLSGWDHARAGERLFRLDRVGGELVPEGAPSAFERPHLDDVGPPPAWRLGDDEEMEAELLVDAEQARWAADALGENAVTERRQDGSVVFRVPVTNSGAFVTFVLGFLHHAEVLGPPALRASMIGWLEGISNS